MNDIKTLISEYEKVQQEFRTKAQKLFKDMVKEFFTAVPEINVIKWVQYTPYFNDGDTCEFSVHEPVIGFTTDTSLISSWGEYDGEEEGEWACEIRGWNGNWAPKEIPESLKTDETKKAAIENLHNFFSSSAMEEVFLQMFRDHVEVTITPKGISIDEYSHD